MASNEFYVSQDGHVVNLIPPVNAAGGLTTAVFNMKGWRHASIVLQFGVQSAALKNISLLSSDDNASGLGEQTTPIPFNVHKCETAYNVANGDVLGPRVAVPSTGFAPSGTGDIFYVLELDSETLPAGQDYVKLVLTDNSPAAASVLASAQVILSTGRFAHDQSETVLT